MHLFDWGTITLACDKCGFGISDLENMNAVLLVK